MPERHVPFLGLHTTLLLQPDVSGGYNFVPLLNVHERHEETLGNVRTNVVRPVLMPSPPSVYLVSTLGEDLMFRFLSSC